MVYTVGDGNSENCGITNESCDNIMQGYVGTKFEIIPWRQ